MFISIVKKIFLLFLACAVTAIAWAQKAHFVYLQTDNGQAFYVKFNNKIISSSSEGYLILPGITDGKYQVVIGFPKKEFPEEKFDLTVDQKNQGFILKNFDQKGWELFNLQTLALTEGVHDQPAAVAAKSAEDPFSKMLAGVVKDSSILQNHQAAVPVPVKTDSALVTDSSLAQAGHKPVLPAAVGGQDLRDSGAAGGSGGVSRLLRSQDKDGMQLVYRDTSENHPDTVRIFFPVQKNSAAADTGKAPVEIKSPAKPAPVDSGRLTITPTIPKSMDDLSPVIPSAKPDTPVKRDTVAGNVPSVDQKGVMDLPGTDSANGMNSVKKAQDASLVKKAEEKKAALPAPAVADESDKGKDSTTTKFRSRPLAADSSADQAQAPVTEMPKGNDQLVVLPKVVTSSRVNSDCKDFATNEDFLRLRKKMAAENGVDNMLRVAKKYFKTKCFSTEQVKNLSYLFLTDEGKYMFFDEAYAFTSDSDQYQILQSQFKDAYYLNRFKAMIRK